MVGTSCPASRASASRSRPRGASLAPTANKNQFQSQHYQILKWTAMISPPCPQEGPLARPVSPGTCPSSSSAGSSPRPPPTSAVAEVLRWQCPSRRGRHRRRSGRRRRNRCRRRRRQSHQVLQPGRMPRSQPLAPLGLLEVKWKKLVCKGGCTAHCLPQGCGYEHLAHRTSTKS